MESEPTPTPDRRRPPSAILALGGAAVAVVIAGAALVVASGSDDADTVGTADEASSDPAETVAPTSEPAPTTAARTTAAPTSEPPAEVDEPIDLAPWVGTYEWSEAVEGIGSDQVIVHRLTLDAVSDSGGAITGRLRQDGFQTATDLRIRALPVPDGVAIELVEVDRGTGIEVPGDVLFELSGDPDRPLTTLRELLTLRIDHPETGTYFLPAANEQADDGELAAPAAFWAIEDGSYDLVRVETATGEVLRRVAGWGPLDEDDELGGQALVGVDAGSEGIVWVSDCCEPAVGGLFGIGPDTTGIDAPLATAFGVAPQISPDGTLVAMGVLEQGVQISDARTGDTVVAAEEIGPLLGRPTEAAGFAHPLAWVDDRLLAIAVSDGNRSAITFVDIGLAGGPTAVSQGTIDGDVRHGSIRADGNLVVLVASAEGDLLAVVDPTEASVIDRGPVEGAIVAIDYDAAGRELALLDADGRLAVVGPDGIEREVPGRYLDVSW